MGQSKSGNNLLREQREDNHFQKDAGSHRLSGLLPFSLRPGQEQLCRSELWDGRRRSPQTAEIDAERLLWDQQPCFGALCLPELPMEQEDQLPDSWWGGCREESDSIWPKSCTGNPRGSADRAEAKLVNKLLVRENRRAWGWRVKSLLPGSFFVFRTIRPL